MKTKVAQFRRAAMKFGLPGVAFATGAQRLQVRSEKISRNLRTDPSADRVLTAIRNIAYVARYKRAAAVEQTGVKVR